MIKKGDLALKKDNKQGSSSSSNDKPQVVNNNWDVMNDGAINNMTFKPLKAMFNLITTMYVDKTIEQTTKK